MPDVRLIDANALCKKINSSIKLALEWENEAREKKDTHGVKCAIDTRRALLAMLSRVQEEPIIEVQPVKHGHWVELPKELNPNELPCQCSNCKHVVSFYYGYPKSKFCDECGAKMDGDADETT